MVDSVILRFAYFFYPNFMIVGSKPESSKYPHNTHANTQ